MINKIISLNMRKEILEYLNPDLDFYNKFVEYYIPPKLFRYSKLNEYVLDSLEKNYIYAANPLTFNDIFDSRCNVDHIKIDQLDSNECKIDSELHLEYYAENTVGGFEYMTEMNRIFCFSQTDNSNLMWSHYADRHTGICIEYNFNNENVPEIIRKSIFPVKYIDKPIDISKLCSFHNIKIEVAMMISMLTKSSEWSYEKEWRCITGFAGLEKYKEGLKLKSVKPNSILLGSKFFDELQVLNKNKDLDEKIKRIKRLINFVTENKVNIKIFIPIIETFKLEKVDIDIERLNCIFNSDLDIYDIKHKILDYIKELRIRKYIEYHKINYIL